MRLGGRLSAAIEVLSDIDKRHRNVADALKSWGLAHRFAGAGDRAAIGNIVYDALRKKQSHAYLMDDDSATAIAHAVLFRQWNITPEMLAKELDGDKFAPEAISESALKAFASKNLEDAAPYVQADIPEWTVASFEENFDDQWIREAEAFTLRPSLDLRVNTLKANTNKVLKSLIDKNAEATSISLNGIRIPAGTGASRLPNVTASVAFEKGWFEVQDEGSQIVSELIYAQPGEQILDYCAGGGGKTLALSAAMNNKGQLHAYDNDRKRLAPIIERLKRAGTRNVQVHENIEDLAGFAGRMDRVVVDAPCTGTGTWRRRPDTKWKLKKNILEERLKQQEEALTGASNYVRPGGYLVYITCSILPEENEGQVYQFCEDNTDFEILSLGEVWQDIYGFEKPAPWSSDMKTITLTPAATNTDGFFICVMARKS